MFVHEDRGVDDLLQIVTNDHGLTVGPVERTTGYWGHVPRGSSEWLLQTRHLALEGLRLIDGSSRPRSSHQ